MTSRRLPSRSSGTGDSPACLYDPSSDEAAHAPGVQPRTSPVAHFASAPNDGIGNDALRTTSGQRALPVAGRLLAANAHYVAYAVKKGLVRVIDRRTSAKTLLRGHGEGTRIVDAAFFGAEVDGQTKEGAAAPWRRIGDGRRGRLAENEPSAAASDILATVGGMQDEACVLVWRIYVKPPHSRSDDASLTADRLIELRLPSAARILWHPFDPNRFLLLHRNSGGAAASVGTLVETKRLVTAPHKKSGHAVCDCPRSAVPGATQFVVSRVDEPTPAAAAGAGANDASWSAGDARHVLTAHDDGTVRLWDVTLPPEPADPGNASDSSRRRIVTFPCVARLDVASTSTSTPGFDSEAARVTRVIFLSQYTSWGGPGDGVALTPPFVTGTNMNHSLTLWSGFRLAGSSNAVRGNVAPPQRLYLFQLRSTASPPPPSVSSILTVELCPAPYRPVDTIPSSFLLLCERSRARMHALHIDTRWKNDDDAREVAVAGFDYVTSLDVVHPILSLCVAPSSSHENAGFAASESDEEREVDLCCVQTKAVQMLSLSADMLSAPAPKNHNEAGELSDAVTLLHWNKEEEERDVDEITSIEEEYELEEDRTQAEVDYSTGDDDDGDDDHVPKDPSAPIVDDDAAVDPFSNWLGAIVNPLPPPTVPSSNDAATTTTSATAPPPPPPGMDFMFPPPPPPGLTSSAPTAPLKEEMAFLSPMQLLGKTAPDPVVSANVSGKSRDAGASAKKSTAPSSKKKKGGGGGGGSDNAQKPPPPPTAILQREDARGDTRPTSRPSGSDADIRSIENAVERIVASHVKSLESRVVDAARKTVASEVQSAMEKAAERASRDVAFHQKLEKAAEDSAIAAAREAVASMQAPMMTALHLTMKEIMIPAYEAAVGQMFQQISKTMDQGLAQIATSQVQATAPAMEAMSKQMTKMSEAIQTLSSEVAQLRSTGAAAAAANNNGGQATSQKAPHPPPRPVDARQEILSLCQARRYEEAFTKAVSAANGDIVVFTCKHADIAAAFNGEVTLSQTILICLMQQLGAVLVSATDPTDFKIIVTWLQEIAVTIDPTNENIKRHVGSVVQQLLSNINSKMSKCDPAFRRPLQTLMQVIRGLL